MTQPASFPLPEVLERAFAPLHKLAMGLSVGLTTGLLVFVVTVFHVIAQPVDGPRIGLLSQYFYGYDVTWPGAVVGLWWGFVAGFAGGWFVTFLRNLTLALWIFTTRTRAEMAQSSDFLDHI